MGILVVGVHRSGTSAMAGALEAMGLDAGPPDGLMAGDVGNPDGYYELQAVADLNDEILAHLGGAWHSPPALGPSWNASVPIAGFVRRARDLLAASYGKRTDFVLKDPRISLVLPLW